MPNSPMERYLATLEDEHARTVRVLRSFPDDKLDSPLVDRAKTARELAWLLVRENGMLGTAVTTGFDWTKPFPKPPEPPRTMAEIVEALETGHRDLVKTLREAASLPATVSFFTGPKQLGDVPLWDFLWSMLHDQIHHRGQFSVYLRLAGAKVPSIYGPSADEPWS